MVDAVPESESELVMVLEGLLIFSIIFSTPFKASLNLTGNSIEIIQDLITAKGRKRKASAVSQSKERATPGASGQKRGRKSASSNISRTTYIDMVDENEDEDEGQLSKPVASTSRQVHFHLFPIIIAA